MDALDISKSNWPNTWRNTPLTPPMSTAFERRKMAEPQTTATTTTTLPSIAFLDRQLSDRNVMSALPPLTPPDDVPPPHYSPPSEMDVDPKHQLFVDTHLTAVDWIDFSRTRSAHFIAEKTCEMICYLWFRPPDSSSSSSSYSPPNLSSSSSPLFNRPTPSSTLQLVATPQFVSFMQKLLETTQVSQSVIVLSLHYICRLKDRNAFTPAQAGSEFRIAVAGLMMANKFLDDNTYTNKTWSEVSGIGLEEINRMEREFLMGVDCNLYVDKATYQSWLHLLKGLVMAKERDSRHFRKTRLAARGARHPPHPTAHLTTTPSRYSTRGRVPAQYRARSTSPEPTRRLPYPQVPPSYSFTSTFSYPTAHTQQPQTQPPQYSSTPDRLPEHPAYASASYNSLPPSPTPTRPAPGAGSKRSAATAFSPTSAAFAHIPTKRPVSISLQIPETSAHAISNLLSSNGGSSGSSGPSSNSPLEGLNAFAGMSIDERPGQQPHHQPQPSHQSQHTTPSTTMSLTSSKKPLVPETLVAGYALDPERRTSVPKNLYFYTLACSPLEFADASSSSTRSVPTNDDAVSEAASQDDDARAQELLDADTARYDRIRRGARKARLRYHQPGDRSATPASSTTDNSVHHANPFHYPSSTFGSSTSLHSIWNGATTGYVYPTLRNAMGAGFGYVQSASTSPNDVHVSVVPPTAAAYHQMQQYYVPSSVVVPTQAPAVTVVQAERDEDMGESEGEFEEDEEDEEQDEQDEEDADNGDDEMGSQTEGDDEDEVDVEEVEKPRLPHFQDIAAWVKPEYRQRYAEPAQIQVPSHAQLQTEPPRYPGHQQHYRQSPSQPQTAHTPSRSTHISTSPQVQQSRQRTPVHLTHQLHTPHQSTPTHVSSRQVQNPQTPVVSSSASTSPYVPTHSRSHGHSHSSRYRHEHHQVTPEGSPVKSAPFANAGPPGVHGYSLGGYSPSYDSVYVAAPAYGLGRGLAAYAGTQSPTYGYNTTASSANHAHAATTYPTPVQSYYDQGHGGELWMKRPSIAM
ncbi:hypothetical protein D9758_011631 [Tetrapyrgos nigripes]|uniref:Cyclin-like domain-containing protein n=1 Tax=Tetrapyrgos nigripes TaxID=182062 RepID=A0A8H5CUW8_9AGAR|nr:hypothetical protein D9758_011631 [Tetrapyrgos nigripes]